MKIILFASALLVAATSLRAEQLRDAPVAEIVQQAVPTLTYVVGDKSWGGGGGLYDNAYAGSVIFDANTSFAVFRSQDGSLSLCHRGREAGARLSAQAVCLSNGTTPLIRLGKEGGARIVGRRLW